VAKIKIGAWTLWKISTDLCRALNKFSPYLKATYSDNPALIAALVAAEEACNLLKAEAYKLREFGD
jgi:hypothetical protein